LVGQDGFANLVLLFGKRLAFSLLTIVIGDGKEIISLFTKSMIFSSFSSSKSKNLSRSFVSSIESNVCCVEQSS
jgi:hypothetical protein